MSDDSLDSSSLLDAPRLVHEGNCCHFAFTPFALTSRSHFAVGLPGNGARFKRKTLIGFLCLFLAIVVVLAIVIFAVTRDHPGSGKKTLNATLPKEQELLEASTERLIK